MADLIGHNCDIRAVLALLKLPFQLLGYWMFGSPWCDIHRYHIHSIPMLVKYNILHIFMCKIQYSIFSFVKFCIVYLICEIQSFLLLSNVFPRCSALDVLLSTSSIMNLCLISLDRSTITSIQIVFYPLIEMASHVSFYILKVYLFVMNLCLISLDRSTITSIQIVSFPDSLTRLLQYMKPILDLHLTRPKMLLNSNLR